MIRADGKRDVFCPKTGLAKNISFVNLHVLLEHLWQ
jgi:hypothetical protein